MKNFFKNPLPLFRDGVTEWLRCWTANPMCSARMGSNPILVGYNFSSYTCFIIVQFVFFV